jgi:hypothetical protein
MIVWYTSVDERCGPVCKNLEEAFKFLKDYESKCKKIEVTKGTMSKKEYESLPEFDGF